MTNKELQEELAKYPDDLLMWINIDIDVGEVGVHLDNRVNVNLHMYNDSELRLLIKDK